MDGCKKRTEGLTKEKKQEEEMKTKKQITAKIQEWIKAEEAELAENESTEFDDKIKNVSMIQDDFEANDFSTGYYDEF